MSDNKDRGSRPAGSDVTTIPNVPLLQRLQAGLEGYSAADRAIAAYILGRSEEHTSELQSLMRISYAVFCLKKKTKTTNNKKVQINTKQGDDQRVSTIAK